MSATALPQMVNALPRIKGTVANLEAVPGKEREDGTQSKEWYKFDLQYQYAKQDGTTERTSVPLSAFGYNANAIRKAGIQDGSTVSCAIRLGNREYNGRFFPEVILDKIEELAGGDQSSRPKPQPSDELDFC